MFFIPYGTAEKTGRRRFPIVNVSLVLINVAVFALQLYILLTSGLPALETFLNTYAFVPATLSENPLQITLLTALFLHSGLVHLVGNMLYLLPFGDNVEDRLGRGKYLLFYLLCGFIATIVYTAFNVGSTIPLVGASGAIAGVLGGYIALHSSGSKVKGFFFIFPVQLPAILFIGFWFLMQVFSTVSTLGADTSQGGGVAFLAHVAGFIAGLVLAPLFERASLGSENKWEYKD